MTNSSICYNMLTTKKKFPSIYSFSVLPQRIPECVGKRKLAAVHHWLSCGKQFTNDAEIRHTSKLSTPNT